MRPLPTSSLLQALLIPALLPGCSWKTDTTCEDLKTCDVTDAGAAGGAGGSSATQSSLGGVRGGGPSSNGGLSARSNGGASTAGGVPQAGGTPASGGMGAGGGAQSLGGAPTTGDMPLAGGAGQNGGARAIGGASSLGGELATSGARTTGGVPATGGAPTCSPACSGAKPVCDLGRLNCVECLGDTQCASGKPRCKTSEPLDAGGQLNVCVQCITAADCKNTAEPVCDTATNTCVGCLDSANCKNTAQPVCDAAAKTCVGCLASTDCEDATKPVCDTAAKTCVGCLASADCKNAARPQCNATTKSCVECLSNSDCTTPVESRCDLASDSPTKNSCLPCVANSDCAHVTGREICKVESERMVDADAGGDAGANTSVCVQCTAEDETACAGKSCDPASNQCTSTIRGSRKTCQSCVADSECGTNAGLVDPNSRCVPMSFAGAPHGGGYCLQTVAAGCSRPYAISFAASSLSGAPADAYCGINQSVTTCEAVLDLAGARTCTMDDDCGSGKGGLCKAISVVAPANRCTIACGTDAQCPSGNTCSGTTNGWCQ